MPSPSGIILYDKKPGITSFSALGKIKKTLATKKVGHTGTLDSFAQGLLVVCVGSLTRLAGLITAFDKEYEALLVFGEKTDTLDPTGKIVQRAALPTLASLSEAIKKFTGNIMQRPPEFSAIKIGGKRASDLARSGGEAKIPERPVVVYEACLLEAASDSGNVLDLSDGGALVKTARVRFLVSKGTYIRSLARDIGEASGSCASLETLKRTRVGNFLLKDAANEGNVGPSSLLPLSQETAALCGLGSAVIKESRERDFLNGRPLREGDFLLPLKDGKSVVFGKNGVFFGAVEKVSGRVKYDFVVPCGGEGK
mgnify:CR=1 FL=1